MDKCVHHSRGAGVGVFAAAQYIRVSKSCIFYRDQVLVFM